MKTMIVIKNERGEFFDVGWGWIKLQDAEDDCPFTIFTEEEKQTFKLPEGGRWEVLE